MLMTEDELPDQLFPDENPEAIHLTYRRVVGYAYDIVSKKAVPYYGGMIAVYRREDKFRRSV